MVHTLGSAVQGFSPGDRVAVGAITPCFACDYCQRGFTSQCKGMLGGYKFTGRKAFGSLTPVWTRLGIHGLDTSDPANPKVVHGFLALWKNRWFRQRRAIFTGYPLPCLPLLDVAFDNSASSAISW